MTTSGRTKVAGAEETQQLEVDRIVRCRKTNRYFTGKGWDNNISAANVFPNQLEAVRTSIVQDLYDIDFILLARETGQELFCIRLR